MLRMLHDSSGARERVRMSEDSSGERDRRPMTRMLHSTSGRNNFSGGEPRMLHTTSGRPQFNNVADETSGVRVTCDNCRANVIGLRYKCSSCPNFDFCPQCMNDYEDDLNRDSSSRLKRFAHPFNHHIFQRITFRVTNSSAPAFQNRQSWRHHGVKCSNCPSSTDDIVGYRYFCTNCAVSLCESCELAGVHRLDHNLLKMVPPHIANDPSWQLGSGSSRK